ARHAGARLNVAEHRVPAKAALAAGRGAAIAKARRAIAAESVAEPPEAAGAARGTARRAAARTSRAADAAVALAADDSIAAIAARRCDEVARGIVREPGCRRKRQCRESYDGCECAKHRDGWPPLLEEATPYPRNVTLIRR